MPEAIVPVSTEFVKGDTLLSGLAENAPDLITSYSEEKILPAAEPVPAPDTDLIFPGVQKEPDDTYALLAMMGFANANAAEGGEITSSDSQGW